MAMAKKSLKTLKKKTAALFDILLSEHAKLTIIIGLTIFACLFIYIYKHPASVPNQTTPIELLPLTLGAWKGEPVFLAVPMKNNRYRSVVYTDTFGHQLRFISYQRQNEKHEQLHYPEDCLRANGYFDTSESSVPLVIGEREICFKKIVASRGVHRLCHYYVVFSGNGEPVTYGVHRQDIGISNFQKLLAQRLQLHRNNDQLYLFTLTATEEFPAAIDARVQSFLQAMPLGFFPGK
jgi:hypothetical protein